MNFAKYLFLILILFGAKAYSQDVLSGFQTELSLIDEAKKLSDTNFAGRKGQLQNQIFQLRKKREIKWAESLSSLEDSRVFSKDGLLLVNPKFKFVDESSLQSGDLLLNRGTGSVSHLIASQGEIAQSYTHVSVFFRDSAGMPFTIEANQFGLVVIPFNGLKDISWSDRGSVRAMVLRNPNHVWARRAAEILVTLARTYGKSTGDINSFQENLPFNMLQNDFELDKYKSLLEIYQDIGAKDVWGYSKVKMKCTESARIAYRLASIEVLGKEVSIPSSLGKSAWYKYLQNLEVYPDFIPLDAFVTDPNFEVVAEWTSPELSEQFLFEEETSFQLLNDVRFGKYISKVRGSSKLLSRTTMALSSMFASTSAEVLKFQRAQPEFVELLFRNNFELSERMSR